MRVGRNATRRGEHRGICLKLALSLLVAVIAAKALLPARGQAEELRTVSHATVASPPSTTLPDGDTPVTLNGERGKFYHPKPIPALQALMLDTRDEPMSEPVREQRFVNTIKLLGDEVTWLLSHLEGCFGHKLEIEKVEMSAVASKMDSSEFNESLVLAKFQNPFEWSKATVLTHRNRSLRRRLAVSTDKSVMDSKTAVASVNNLQDALAARAELVESVLGLQESGAVVWTLQTEYLLQEGSQNLLDAISQLTGLRPHCEPEEMHLLGTFAPGRVDHPPQEVVGKEATMRLRDMVNWTIEERIGYWPEETLEHTEQDLYRLPIEPTQLAFEDYVNSFSGLSEPSVKFAWSPEKQDFAEKQKIPRETGSIARGIPGY